MEKIDNRQSKHLGIIRFNMSRLKEALLLPEPFKIVNVRESSHFADCFEVTVEDPDNHYDLPETKEGNQIPYITVSVKMEYKVS